MELSEIAEIKPDMSAEILEDFNAYLEPFILPEQKEDSTWATGGNLCSCGKALDGLLGTFEWGIKYGDGFCSECGQLVRYYHTIKDRHGKVLAELKGVMFLYRPKED